MAKYVNPTCLLYTHIHVQRIVPILLVVYPLISPPCLLYINSFFWMSFFMKISEKYLQVSVPKEIDKSFQDVTYDTLWKINIDPEHDQFIVETSLPTPICQGLC